MSFIPLKVLIACEFSGVVRNAFLDRGHDAWSCDILPTENRPNRHIQDDARNVINDDWDLLMIAHPPCTRLCNSGVRWLHKPPRGKTLKQMWNDLDEACSLFSDLWNANIPHICAENPIMHKYAKQRIDNFQEHSQIIQPYQFGHGETKATCLWLRELPKLKPTNIVEGREARVHKMPPSPTRWKERSRFYTGIADAMASQWGNIKQLHVN